MKKLIVALVAVIAVGAYAEKSKEPSAAREAPKSRRVMKGHGGGYVIRPGLKPGTIAILNGQKAVLSSEFARLAKDFEKQLMINVPVIDCSVAAGIAGPKEAFKNSKANFAVVVVDCKECDNSIAVFPDQRYAVVNVNALRANGGEVEAFLRARTRKEVMRAFMIVTGAFTALSGKNVLSPVNDYTDLDKIVIEDMPIEALARISKYLTNSGCNRAVRVPYAKACVQGWAPAPTNDVQKAIWDKVHTIPKNPIKIEFDPKKGK